MAETYGPVPSSTMLNAWRQTGPRGSCIDKRFARIDAAVSVREFRLFPLSPQLAAPECFACVIVCGPSAPRVIVPLIAVFVLEDDMNVAQAGVYIQLLPVLRGVLMPSTSRAYSAVALGEARF